MARTANGRRKGDGRALFRALAADIRAELDAGWPLKTVHARFAPRLGIGYAQFTRYVAADRRGTAVKPARPSCEPASPSPPPAPAVAAPRPPVAGLPTFVFDPRGLADEDLF